MKTSWIERHTFFQNRQAHNEGSEEGHLRKCPWEQLKTPVSDMPFYSLLERAHGELEGVHAKGFLWRWVWADPKSVTFGGAMRSRKANQNQLFRLIIFLGHRSCSECLRHSAQSCLCVDSLKGVRLSLQTNRQGPVKSSKLLYGYNAGK